MTVDDYFRDRPPIQREVYGAVEDHLRSLGPLIVEAVGVGILFKRRRTFVEVRGRQRWLNLSFMLDHSIDHERINRVVRWSGHYFCATRLGTPADVDHTVRAWLTESYATTEP
jgi:predicted transport protein